MYDTYAGSRNETHGPLVSVVVVVVEVVVSAGFRRGFVGANPMLLLPMSNSV